MKDVTWGLFIDSIDSVSGIIFFMTLLEIQWEFFSTDQSTLTSQILTLSWYLLVQKLHLPPRFIFWNCHGTRSHFESRPKTVNIHGYSELRKPIRTRENCYSLIWWILQTNTTPIENTTVKGIFQIQLTSPSFAHWNSVASLTLNLLNRKGRQTQNVSLLNHKLTLSFSSFLC